MMSLKSVDITKKTKTIKPLLEHVRTKSHCYDKLFMTGVVVRALALKNANAIFKAFLTF